MKHGMSTSVDLDKAAEVAEKNATEAIKMLCYYLKLKQLEEKSQ